MRYVALKLLPAWFQRALVVIALALALGMVFVSAAIAAPKAQSAEECGVSQEIALASRSMAMEGLERAKVDAILKRMWLLQSPRAEAVVKAIVDAAFRVTWDQTEFADRLGEMCVQRQGDMDEILGRDS